MLSASAALRISIARSFEKDRKNAWAAQPIVPMPSYKADSKPKVLAGYPVQRAPDVRVLSEYGDPKTLPRLSKIQCIITKKVAENYGYLYPYIPSHLEEEIPEKEMQWVDEAVREFFQIPLKVLFNI